MKRRHACVITLLMTLPIDFLSPGQVWATFHLWKIDQIYSNASGNVQFVQLSDTENGEILVGGKTLTSNGHTFTFPSDLAAGTPTAGHHLLLATSGYSALAGVAKADFTLPDHFLNTSGDTLTYAGGLDSVTFTSAQLPIDGIHSLNRSAPGQPLVTGVNSATDLASQGGQIPPWENQVNRFDVDGSGKVAAKDVGNLINDLLENGVHQLAIPAPGHSPPPFLDVNGDNFVKASDVNAIITFLLDNPKPTAIAADLLSSTAELTFSSLSSSRSPAISTAMLSSSIRNVPEPTSEFLAFVGAGLLGFIGVGRRKQTPCDLLLFSQQFNWEGTVR